ncbi:speckle-type POZ protein B [Caerostris extrusa]|uniref:Speckle-type POZ protein B n=1 Tax=Caerostris extrusa TaxID=172846 RepID=A0AAV4N246_CAEEX|nr:speckle-type POZ protein B [Caerostris extrusa]
MWSTNGSMAKYVECFARTHIAVTEANYVWKVEGLDTVPAYQRITYPIKSLTEAVLMNLSLFLNEYRFMYFELAAQDQEFGTSVVLTNNLNGNNSGVFSSITLNCRLKFSTGIDQEQIETIRYGNVNLRTTLASSHAAVEETLSEINSILKKNTRSLFDRDFASDVVLKTKTRSFFAHKSILNAHSPVFAAMFSSGMKESTCDRVDIQDLDDDTVQLASVHVHHRHRPVDWERARRLYAAADKYAVLPLKKMCSIHLKTNLQPCNACQVLHLADLHQDGDLKCIVQDFILVNSKEVMISEEWKLLLETSPKLAAETKRSTFKK